ncbi:type I glyceraldehyde-3-phosphate dehydrogenase [Suttonella sp. R2A3]|uniref:type I glyceraldehyde-3-phosphate dehydrogenase n=1 Tax=Suttonella sp. R2A3 TaxID=2908648 RepID=UPI001F2125C9|nr:type I glyceraldehyde-3-phosphate dehydrogenase [Suttonella sp. R2A3]UJF25169.1 type I glyceraldehyde-3-phosphate dehydrogenase [Suttonella sp. R2A3]
MAIKVAINGFGRIGRCVFRAIYEQGMDDEFELVAINSLDDPEMRIHLLRYDSTHGRFPFEASLSGHDIVVKGKTIKCFSDRDPANLPWGELGVDIVLECTGFFNSKEKSMVHLESGAKKVLLSAPGGSDVDATVVYGVNEGDLTADMQVVSNASCTTNCLAPVAKVLHEKIGIETGLITTIHAYTNDQRILDKSHKDMRRARTAGVSMIPTKTGAAKAVGLVLPELNGRLDGMAIRVPTPNVSMVDLTFTAARDVTVEEINRVLKKAAAGDDSLGLALDYSDEPLVSIDYNHCPASSTVDSLETRVIGDRLVKVLAWYDNEWGFSCRMLDTAKVMYHA